MVSTSWQLWNMCRHHWFSQLSVLWSRHKKLPALAKSLGVFHFTLHLFLWPTDKNKKHSKLILNNSSRNYRPIGASQLHLNYLKRLQTMSSEQSEGYTERGGGVDLFGCTNYPQIRLFIHLERRQDVEASFLPDHPSALQGQWKRPDWDRAPLGGLHQRPPPDTPRPQSQRYIRDLFTTKRGIYTG